MLRRRAGRIAKPKLPDGLRIYAVSDIHGCANLLANVFAAVDLHLSRAEPVRALHVFLGDYIDRGPASCQTIDMLIDRSRQHECIFLKGNHEALLLDILGDAGGLETWKYYGGFPTLISYGIAPPLNPALYEQKRLVSELVNRIPDSHRHFFHDLRPSFSCGDFFFCHAGVRPGVSLQRQREEDLLWIRDEFLESERDFGKFVVHGHTPVPNPDIRSNRINIDTGAYATGVLSLLVIEGERMFTI
jgi:serine/threonine protein phosphatase 1